MAVTAAKTSQEFVDVIKVVVKEGTVRDELDVLRNPPGRRPSREAVDMSL